MQVQNCGTADQRVTGQVTSLLAGAQHGLSARAAPSGLRRVSVGTDRINTKRRRLGDAGELANLLRAPAHCLLAERLCAGLRGCLQEKAHTGRGPSATGALAQPRGAGLETLSGKSCPS